MIEKGENWKIVDTIFSKQTRKPIRPNTSTSNSGAFSIFFLALLPSNR